MALKQLLQIGVQKNELGEIIGVFELKTLDKDQVEIFKKKAFENKSKEHEREIAKNRKIEELENEIAKIKTELSYNRGEITREEYEELCGLNK